MFCNGIGLFENMGYLSLYSIIYSAYDNFWVVTQSDCAILKCLDFVAMLSMDTEKENWSNKQLKPFLQEVKEMVMETKKYFLIESGV